MVLVIGEILFDIFPDYKRLGGAPFNFAYHLLNLGLNTRFITRIGNDEEGKNILQQLKKFQFITDDIQIDDIHSTGKVLIELDNKGIPEFTIVPDVAYDYIELNNSVESALVNETKLIYFGTLIQRNEHGFRNINKILLKKNKNTKCLYDINLRPNCFNNKIIIESLKNSTILKLNDEELNVIKGIIGSGKGDNEFIETLMMEYSLDMVSLTRGDKGSDLFTQDGHYDIKPTKVDSIVDTVGAGDAYTAILAIGYLNQWEPKRILETATAFAANICQTKGAIPIEKKFYNKFKNMI